MTAETLAQILTLLQTDRPAWLPSQAWDDLVRQGAVLTPEEATTIKQRIKHAPEATIGRVFAQILGVLKGIV